MDYQTVNVCAVGVCFAVLGGCFLSLADLQKTILVSAHEDNPNFNVDGYTYLGAFFSSFAISLWFSSSVVSLVGPRWTMVFGCMLFIIPPVTILLEKALLLYLAGILNGVGSSLVWTGSATYLVLNSTKENLSRNTGLFWFFYSWGPLVGNIFLFFAFRNATEKIDEATRRLVLFGAIGVYTAATFLFLLLRREKITEEEKKVLDSPLAALKKSWIIGKSRNIAILFAAFTYCGLHMTLITGVYGSSIGFTLRLGEGVKKLIPLSAMLIGCGEVFGGVLVKVFGNINICRINFFFVLAVVVNVICYQIVFISLPANANFGNTTNQGIIEPRIWLLLIASFCFGMGDSLVHIQLYTLVGSLYPKDSAPAFSIFKFLRAVSASTSFYYSRYLLLTTQLIILSSAGFLAMIFFNIMNVIHERNESVRKD